jgi:hypothetical protein
MVPSARVERATGLIFQPILHTRNGGLAVRGVAAAVGDRSDGG